MGTFNNTFGNSFQQGALVNFEPEIKTYLTGLVTPLSNPQQIKLNRFVKTIKVGFGITSLANVFDILRMPVETAEGRLRNLAKNAHHATAINSPVFTANKGFKGNGTTSYINENYNPFVDAVTYTVSNASIGLYSGTDNVSTVADSGCIQTGPPVVWDSFYLKDGFGKYAMRMNQDNSLVFDPLNEFGTGGLIILNRQVNDLYVYNKGLKITKNNIPYSTIPNAPLYSLARSGITSFSDREQAMFFCGRALTDSEEQILRSAIYDYLHVYNAEFPANIRVRAWGDSLTRGTGGGSIPYPTALATLLGAGYSVSNYGVGGESSLSVLSRHGSLLPKLVNSVNIPADLSLVAIGTTTVPNIVSDWDNIYQIKLLVQETAINGGINPMLINNVECNLSYTAGTYYINRVVAGTAVTFAAGSKIYTRGNFVLRATEVLLLWVGTNGGYTTTQDLINQIKSAINISGVSKYIVIGLHFNATYTIAQWEQLEADMMSAFGSHYYNNRKYLVTNGLADAGITPTAQDLIDIGNGYPPTSLRFDLIHFNTASYNIVATQVKNIGTSLGYW